MAIELAQQKSTPFEVCITSNYQSGAVSNLSDHPVTQMLAKGLNVTINTDDPSISQITLSDEYRLVCEVLEFSIEDLEERVMAAARAAFLPEGDKQRLINALQAEFLDI